MDDAHSVWNVNSDYRCQDPCATSSALFQCVETGMSMSNSGEHGGGLTR